MGAAGVEVDKHLGLAVAVEVADADRATGPAHHRPVTGTGARMDALRRRVEPDRPAPHDPQVDSAVDVVRLAVGDLRLRAADAGGLRLEDVAAQPEPEAADRPRHSGSVVCDPELPLARGLLAVQA